MIGILPLKQDSLTGICFLCGGTGSMFSVLIPKAFHHGDRRSLLEEEVDSRRRKEEEGIGVKSLYQSI